jgi:hypothetical protein
MKTSRLFLVLIVLIALECLSTVQGQYGITNTYSSDTSTSSSTLSATSQYGQYYPMSPGQIPSQAPGYLRGTVLSIRDENSMYVNFTNSNIPGMEGATLILLSGPVSIGDLIYFQGKELTFSILGHDILGRPVCDAYFEGIPIDDYLRRYERYGYYSPGYGYYSSESLQISEQA